MKNRFAESTKPVISIDDDVIWKMVPNITEDIFRRYLCVRVRNDNREFLPSKELRTM